MALLGLLGATVACLGFRAGAGTQNAGLAIGGGSPASATSTEEYNGSSWVTGGLLPSARQSVAGTGTQNAGFAIGGANSPVSFSDTYTYNGSSWSSDANTNVARYGATGYGSTTSALVDRGGRLSGGTNVLQFDVETYNGTSWTTGISSTTRKMNHAGAGDDTNALSFGGYGGSPSPFSPGLTLTEEYNAGPGTPGTPGTPGYYQLATGSINLA